MIIRCPWRHKWDWQGNPIGDRYSSFIQVQDLGALVHITTKSSNLDGKIYVLMFESTFFICLQNILYKVIINIFVLFYILNSEVIYFYSFFPLNSQSIKVVLWSFLLSFPGHWTPPAEGYKMLICSVPLNNLTSIFFSSIKFFINFLSKLWYFLHKGLLKAENKGFLFLFAVDMLWFCVSNDKSRPESAHLLFAFSQGVKSSCAHFEQIMKIFRTAKVEIKRKNGNQCLRMSNWPWNTILLS